jgi:hypothetical protein
VNVDGVRKLLVIFDGIPMRGRHRRHSVRWQHAVGFDIGATDRDLVAIFEECRKMEQEGLSRSRDIVVIRHIAGREKRINTGLDHRWRARPAVD